MSRSSYSHKTGAVLTIALSLSLVTIGQSFALSRPKTAPKATETVVVQPEKNNTPDNIARVSRLANQVLAKIQDAQASIDTQKLDSAKTQLSEAQELLDNIQQTGPTARVIDTVQTKRKELQRSEEVSLDLVPLDAELVSFEKIVSVPEAKEHLALAKKSLAERDPKAASKHLQEVENSLIYAEADLPVSRTRQDVLSAESLLGQNKPEAANRVLQDSLKHIMIMTAEADNEQTVQQDKPDLSTTKKHPKVLYSLPTKK
jgi:hypothetical protein